MSFFREVVGKEMSGGFLPYSLVFIVFSMENMISFSDFVLNLASIIFLVQVLICIQCQEHGQL